MHWLFELQPARPAAGGCFTWQMPLIFDTFAMMSTTLPGISLRSWLSVIIVVSSTSHSSPAATPCASTPKSASVRATLQQCACSPTAASAHMQAPLQAPQHQHRPKPGVARCMARGSSPAITTRGT